ncbi:hypothetical protein EMPS_03424 [Entomortierella parvispora]|uniref:Uncharacterized protein n=1 Tax=Entomortierella parvispora TaxID=205924 RepID=A0A9P3H6R5_9FUNG|nr:hypothetical protein EMPS_03424 [Entomortierella parvispora]
MLVIKSILLLCSAAVVLARTNIQAVVSDAIFVGENTVDDSASPLEIFSDSKNHAEVVSSVLVFSADRANFQPASQPAKSLALNLREFIEKASTFPGFIMERSEQESLPLNGSLTQFEKVVREAGIAQPHQALVARSLRDMIPGYIVNEDVDEWKLSLIVIDKPKGADVAYVNFVRVDVSIDADKTGTTFIPEQAAGVSSVVIRTNLSYLVEYAEKLSSLIPITNVRDALVFFASPKVESDPADSNETSCHKNPLAFVNQGQRSLYNWKNGN